MFVNDSKVNVPLAEGIRAMQTLEFGVTSVASSMPGFSEPGFIGKKT